jgi:hypothetical protein
VPLGAHCEPNRSAHTAGRLAQAWAGSADAQWLRPQCASATRRCLSDRSPGHALTRTHCTPPTHKPRLLPPARLPACEYSSTPNSARPPACEYSSTPYFRPPCPLQPSTPALHRPTCRGSPPLNGATNSCAPISLPLLPMKYTSCAHH